MRVGIFFFAHNSLFPKMASSNVKLSKLSDYAACDVSEFCPSASERHPISETDDKAIDTTRNELKRIAPLILFRERTLQSGSDSERIDHAGPDASTNYTVTVANPGVCTVCKVRVRTFTLSTPSCGVCRKVPYCTTICRQKDSESGCHARSCAVFEFQNRLHEFADPLQRPAFEEWCVRRPWSDDASLTRLVESLDEAKMCCSSVVDMLCHWSLCSSEPYALRPIRSPSELTLRRATRVLRHLAARHADRSCHCGVEKTELRCRVCHGSDNRCVISNVFRAYADKRTQLMVKLGTKSFDVYTHCSGCGSSQMDLKACTICRSEFYCDKICQTRDWTRHRSECKPFVTARELERVFLDQLASRDRLPNYILNHGFRPQDDFLDNMDYKSLQALLNSDDAARNNPDAKLTVKIAYDNGVTVKSKPLSLGQLEYRTGLLLHSVLRH
jgi:hypothetical protein